jgi:hypothetical protein
MKIITTNGKPRDLLYSHDVPDSILQDYDHLDESDLAYGWIHYNRSWYHVSDFMRLEKDCGLSILGFDGSHCLSFGFAILIDLREDDQVVMGSILYTSL